MCSFCHTEAGKNTPFFHKFSVTTVLWNQLLIFEADLDFPDLTPQVAFFGFINESHYNLNMLQNHILIFKLYVNQSTEKSSE